MSTVERKLVLTALVKIQWVEDRKSTDLKIT
jgi:hypothetical protein